MLHAFTPPSPEPEPTAAAEPPAGYAPVKVPNEQVREALNLLESIQHNMAAMRLNMANVAEDQGRLTELLLRVLGI